jgi:hypothetical protein
VTGPILSHRRRLRFPPPNPIAAPRGPPPPPQVRDLLQRFVNIRRHKIEDGLRMVAQASTIRLANLSAYEANLIRLNLQGSLNMFLRFSKARLRGFAVGVGVFACVFVCLCVCVASVCAFVRVCVVCVCVRACVRRGLGCCRAPGAWPSLSHRGPRPAAAGGAAAGEPGGGDDAGNAWLLTAARQVATAMAAPPRDPLTTPRHVREPPLPPPRTPTHDGALCAGEVQRAAGARAGPPGAGCALNVLTIHAMCGCRAAIKACKHQGEGCCMEGNLL